MFTFVVSFLMCFECWRIKHNFVHGKVKERYLWLVTTPQYLQLGITMSIEKNLLILNFFLFFEYPMVRLDVINIEFVSKHAETLIKSFGYACWC